MKVCIYHSKDLDGMCSGAIVKRKYPQTNFVGMDYHDRIPWEVFEAYRHDVIMVDFSFQPFDNMLRLAKLAKSMLWIDHHKSAIEDYYKMAALFPNSFTSASSYRLRSGHKLAACELTWMHIFGTYPMPEVVRYVGRYDVWDHADEMVEPMHYGLGALDTRVEGGDWQRLFDCDYDALRDIARTGKSIMDYVYNDYAQYVGKNSFEVMLGEYKCIAINRPDANSSIFRQLDVSMYDMMMVFGWKHGIWSVSLYTTHARKLDVGAVAKSYGGGGHANAGGFTCKTLPFDLA